MNRINNRFKLILSNLIYIIKVFFKNIFPIFLLILENIIPPIFVLLVGLFFLSLPFVAIAAIYKYFRDDFGDDMSPVLNSILNFLYDKYIFIIGFIDKNPKSVLVVGIILFILVIRIFSSKILIRKDNYRTFFKAIFHTLILVMTSFIIVYYDNLSEVFKLLNEYINDFLLSKLKIENTNFDIKIDRVFYIYFLIFYAIVWINNRLIWLVSIFLLQIVFLYTYYNTIIDWLNKFPHEYIRILQGIVPLLIISPYVLVVWIFRDNDKYREYDLKQRELRFKERDLRLKEKELINKEKELSLRQQEYNLKKNQT